jgi:hypothetical protein
VAVSNAGPMRISKMLLRLEATVRGH